MTLLITSSVSAMADSEKERLQEELSSLRAIIKMEDLAEEDRVSLQLQIQDLENQLQVQPYLRTRIRKHPTPASSSSAPATSSSPSHYLVEEELERLRSMEKRSVEDDDAIKLLEAAQRAGITKYRSSIERLRRLVVVFSPNPPR